MKRNLFYSRVRKDALDSFRSAIDRDGESLKKQMESKGILTFSLFISGCHAGVYLESLGNGYEWDWPGSYRIWLEEWPGEDESRLSVSMIDIFHDGVPSDHTSWRGKRVVEKRVGSFAKLKPDMAASYIFYHYQKQEETPESFNKTYIVGAQGPFLFSYYEWPASLGETKRKGLLLTNNTPEDWHAVMQPHFVPWENAEKGQEYWRPAEFIHGF